MSETNDWAHHSPNQPTTEMLHSRKTRDARCEMRAGVNGWQESCVPIDGDTLNATFVCKLLIGILYKRETFLRLVSIFLTYLIC